MAVATGWVKYTQGLRRDPKVIAIASILQKDPRFGTWACGSNVTLCDTAAVTLCAAVLCETWCWARLHGRKEGTDCFLGGIEVSGIDQMAGGVPGLGIAMEAVGWVFSDPGRGGVVLPKFFESKNIPSSSADRMREKRARDKGGVTGCDAVVTPCDENVTDREEKSIKEGDTQKGYHQYQQAGTSLQDPDPFGSVDSEVQTNDGARREAPEKKKASRKKKSPLPEFKQEFEFAWSGGTRRKAIGKAREAFAKAVALVMTDPVSNGLEIKTTAPQVATWIANCWIRFCREEWPEERIKSISVKSGDPFPMPLMTTWLNQGRYGDDVEPWKDAKEDPQGNLALRESMLDELKSKREVVAAHDGNGNGSDTA